jgi:hypothetical protein
MRTLMPVTLLLALASPIANADLGFKRSAISDGRLAREYQIAARPLATDYQCVSDCTAQGYLYNLCVDKCSWSDDYRRPKQVDYQCVNDCTARGYQYNYCVDRCSF